MSNAIEIENLAKQYRIGQKEALPGSFVERIQSLVTAPWRNLRNLRRLSRTSSAEDRAVVWALRDVNLEIAEGEVMGVIGANGAGKSTLLKILAKITRPTTGEARVRGRVGSLLEVGTGFHPELTGRENIYLNGTLLGMRKREIDRRFDEIVDFSELETFLDTPVKRYSSGMRVRLAFSVAAHLEPEILLVDEVLAVGDLKFQQKSLRKIEDVSSHARTVLIVSHQLSMITQLCRQCIMMERGRLAFQGAAAEAVSRYSLLAESGSREAEPIHGPSIQILCVNGRDASQVEEIPNDETTVVDLAVLTDRPLGKSRMITIIEDAHGTQVVHHTFECDSLVAGENRLQSKIPPLRLLPGVYGLHYKLLTPTLRDEGDWRILSEVRLLHYSGPMQPYGPLPPWLAPDVVWEVGSAN